MMGSNDKPQDELFYAFNLDEIVPQDHLLRDIDRVLDLSDLREHLAPYYSHTGRPSVDPELMIRMLLIGYCGGSRAINEYLDALQDDGSSIAPAKKVSQTDPMARWTAVLGGPAYYAYSTNYLVDTEAGIIVDVEATPALTRAVTSDEASGTSSLDSYAVTRQSTRRVRFVSERSR